MTVIVLGGVTWHIPTFLKIHVLIEAGSGVWGRICLGQAWEVHIHAIGVVVWSIKWVHAVAVKE